MELQSRLQDGTLKNGIYIDEMDEMMMMTTKDQLK
jgi:hypothetical protein